MGNKHMPIYGIICSFREFLSADQSNIDIFNGTKYIAYVGYLLQNVVFSEIVRSKSIEIWIFCPKNLQKCTKVGGGATLSGRTTCLFVSLSGNRKNDTHTPSYGHVPNWENQFMKIDPAFWVTKWQFFYKNFPNTAHAGI